MDGKILIGTNGTSYNFATGGTRVINIVGLNTPIAAGLLERVFLVYNETQKITYYAPTATLSLLTVSALNTLTISGTLPVINVNDSLKILIWEVDYTANLAQGYESTAEINKIPLEFDTYVTLASAQAITASFAVLGSEFSTEGRNSTELKCKLVASTSTGFQFKAIGRYTAGSTDTFPLDFNIIGEADLTFDASTYGRIWQLRNNANQNFTIQIFTNNNISTVEIDIAVLSLAGSPTITAFMNKAFSPMLQTIQNVRNVNTHDGDETFACSAVTTTNAELTVFAAGGSGVRHYITDMQLLNISPTGGTEVQLLNGSGGAVLWRSFLPPILATNGIGMPQIINFQTPIRTSSVNVPLIFKAATSGAKIYINAQGYKSL